MRSPTVLGPAVAGSWYPARREALAVRIDGLLDDAAARAGASAEPAMALIAPHAGLDYSGAVAASAFCGLRGRAFDRIVLIGPSHYFGFDGAAIPERATAYRTPLGDVPIDDDVLSALHDAASFHADDKVFEPEHALEAELPFLQRVIGADVPIVPVLLGGEATSADVKHVAEALAPRWSAATLFVISSDFTHFGPRFGYVPFDDDVPSRIRALDRGAIAAIESGDAEGFARYVETTGATICGHRAIEVLLTLMGNAGGAKQLEYDTSGRLTGTWDHSVSYASMAVPAVGSRGR